MRADSSTQMWFAEMGAREDLPCTREQFKVSLADYCCGEGLEDLRKYADEKWSDFIKRLWDWARLRQVPESQVLRRLQRERAMPSTCLVLTYTRGVGLAELVGVGKDLDARSTEGPRGLRGAAGEVGGKGEAKSWCFYCNKGGHDKLSCPRKGRMGQVNATIREQEREVDEEDILINGSTYLALFDGEPRIR